MSAAGTHPLWRAAVLELTCTRSSAGQTVEVQDGTGVPLASADDAGTIAASSGEPLLLAPLAWEGRRDRGTDAKLDVSDPAGTALGEVRVARYSVGPRSSKATLSISDATGEVARLEPQDRKGEELVIAAGDAQAGVLRKTGRKRGLLRSTTSYRLELTGPLEGQLRTLVLAAAIRYQKLLTEAASPTKRER